MTMVEAFFMALTGLYLMFGTRLWVARSQARHRARLADRRARGADAWFEEGRSLEAYPPVTRVWTLRIVGALLTALSAAFFFLDFTS